MHFLLDYQILLYVFLVSVGIPFNSDSAAAIIFTVIAIFSLLAYFVSRPRIPLASQLLQVVIDISKLYKSVFAVAFAALFLQAALSVYVPSYAAFIVIHVADMHYHEVGLLSHPSLRESCSALTLTINPESLF